MDPGSSPFRESCADLDAVSTPAGIKLAWRHAIHEQKLINRILKLSQLSKVNFIRKILHDSEKNTGCHGKF